MFCDEIVLTKGAQNFYGGISTNGFRGGANIARGRFRNVERGHFRQVFSGLATEKVIQRYQRRKVHILESAYDKFQSLNLPSNRIICEIKPGRTAWSGGWVREEMKFLNLPMVEGIDYEFQRKLLKITGPENYMATQILASKYLNWQYICIGGSALLFSVIPAKSILLAEQSIKESDKEIVAGLSPIECWPACFNVKKDLFEDCFQKDIIMNAFKEMSVVDVNFEITLIKGF